MVKVTFKNVNQGDSIILEWTQKENIQVGIIDCSKYNSKINPVLNHIITNNIQEIEFLLLSHPHEDHFSGFYELLSYCRENNIQVKRFLYTSRVAPEFLKYSSKSAEEGKRVIKLFKLAIEMRDNDGLIIANVEDNGFAPKLNDEFSMEFLAPSSREYDNFIKSGEYGFDSKKPQKFDGNWLSTLVNVFNDKILILLTSDCNLQVFNTLNTKLKTRRKNHKTVLAQIPHHGSIENFHSQFWTGLKKFKETFAVISVGKNDYGHPHEDVVSFFEKNSNYTLFRTDTNTIPLSKINSQTSATLDIFSEQVDTITPEEVSHGDKVFVINDSTCSII